MKLFLFERIDHVSNEYHDEGGLVIIAESQEAAYEVIGQYNDKMARGWFDNEPEVVITDDEWEEAKVYELTGDVQPCVYAFPDAGCC